MEKDGGQDGSPGGKQVGQPASDQVAKGSQGRGWMSNTIEREERRDEAKIPTGARAGRDQAPLKTPGSVQRIINRATPTALSC